MQLKSSKVSRGGAASKYWSGSTTRIQSLDARKGLALQFSLASKGGGVTVIEVQLSSEDLERILPNIGKRTPELAPAFAAAAQIAAEQLMARLPKEDVT